MKKLLSLFLVFVMVVSAFFAVSFTAYASEVCTAQTTFGAYEVYVDVSAVETGDETFWAFVWDKYTYGNWVPLQNSTTGYYVIPMNPGDGAVITRMVGEEQPDWNLVINQTDDVIYTGEFNCVVLSYRESDNYRMDAQWKNVEIVYKDALLKAMSDAEKYLFDEPDRYSDETLSILNDAYLDAQTCYETETTQAQVDDATDKLNKAMVELAVKDGLKVNKNNLSFAISTATSYYMSLDRFTSSSWNYMKTKLYDANRVNRDEDATQREVDIAAQELFDAIDALERIKEVVGDVDGDGRANVMDATLVQLHVARLKVFSGHTLFFADVDKDYSITVFDATMIQRIVAQLA